MFFFVIGRNWRRLIPIGVPALFALCMLVLGGLNNDFPFFYHPDEGGKARQALSGSRNYHHPLLQLNTASLAGRMLPGEHDLQHYAQAGRWTAAGFSALTVFCLTLLAFWLAGSMAGVLTGCFLMMDPLLIEHAHYFKEDPAMTFGFAVFLLAVHLHATLPRRGTLLFLGAAAAACVSSKYIGAVVIPFGLFTVWRFPVEGRSRDFLKFAIGLAGIFVLFNFQALSHLPRMFSSIAEEVDKAQNAQSGSLRSVPHSYYLHMWMYRDGSIDLILTAVYASWLIFGFRKIRFVEFLSVALVLCYFAIISMSPKYADRYYLPIQAVVLWWGGLGLAGMAQFLAAGFFRNRREVAVGMVSVVLVAFCWLQIPPAVRMLKGFTEDTRRDLVEFIRIHVPHDAVIAQDKKVKLPNASRPEETLPFLEVNCQVLPPAPVWVCGGSGNLRRACCLGSHACGGR